MIPWTGGLWLDAEDSLALGSGGPPASVPAGADVLRATVADLAWLRERGFAEVIAERASRGRPVLGICGGYQMLGAEIDDPVESGQGAVPGLGILPVRVRFGVGKT